MASQSKGNFIAIKPTEIMDDPIAIFSIVGISEFSTTEYYPIMSNFYDTASWSGVSNTLSDFFGNSVPSQALLYNMVNKIRYNGIIYWLSNINDGSLIYRNIEDGALTISTTDNYNTYTVTYA